MKKTLTVLVVMLLFSVTIYMFLPTSKGASTYEVYYVKEALPAGEYVSEDSLAKRKVYEKFDWMIEELDDVEGLVPQRSIPSGRFVDINDFDKNQPLTYKKGEGEYTIRTKTEYVNGGKIEVGDVVDVIFTPRQSRDGDSDKKGEVISEKLTVISVRTSQGEDIEDSERNQTPYAVTLKAQSEDAVKLAWGQENGALSLFLIKTGGKF
ncbi:MULTISPECIES: Flp pilus assembly protein CpaB [Bacillota]|uniref:Flp pilus assembly protein CpaB n=1 Tax=Bacillota TaxID=1239 RepID=UPI0039EED3A7